MTFYERLKGLMEQTGTTQKQLAELGINKNSFKYWEKHGNIPNSRILDILAKHFNVSVEYLLTGIEIKKEQAALKELPKAEICQRIIEYINLLPEEKTQSLLDYAEYLIQGQNPES